MEEAKRLLKEGIVNVTEAATRIGYSNSSHFAAAFKKRFGINPGLYCHQDTEASAANFWKSLFRHHYESGKMTGRIVLCLPNLFGQPPMLKQ